MAEAVASESADRGRAFADARPVPRHSVLVRVTHWITACAVIALVVSGFAILLAHPRLYWGETGAVGASSLIDLPLPLVLTGQSGWGRSLHFLSAWASVLTGLLYVIAGVTTRHFRADVLPRAEGLRWSSIRGSATEHLRFTLATDEHIASYNILQRLAYSIVLFILFPVMIWTGLAMSPAITSVYPFLVDVAGGQQSARTIHFIAAACVVLFGIVHVAMVCVSGFAPRMRAMTIGGASRRTARP